METTKVKKYSVRLNETKHPYLKEESEIEYSIKDIINSPEEAARLCNRIFDAENLPEEHIFLICLTTKHKVLGIFEVSHGTTNITIANPREIIQRALLCGANTIIVSHNHPSGDATPSKEDIQTTKRLNECARLMGISLSDHIILGDYGRYTSLKEEKLF